MMSMLMNANVHKVASALTGRALSAAHAAGKPMRASEIAKHKRAARAKAAGSSVTGAPGGATERTRRSQGDVRGDLLDAFEEHRR
jgi:hypothetical protein